MDNRNPSTLKQGQQAAPNSYQMEQKALRARKKLEEKFKDFHNIMTDKVLDSNKTSGVKNTERKIVDDLLHAVVELEQVNSGQGLLSLLTISIREHLQTRDRINELEYELYKTKKDMRELEKSINDKGSAKKDVKK